MGYSIWQRSSSFFIDANDAYAALAAIKALHGRETIGYAGNLHFKFVRPEFQQAASLADVLADWRWDVGDLAPDGSITALEFMNDSLGDEDLLFTALAPFVRSGSFIEIIGETGVVWRWLFHCGALYVVPGAVVFPPIDQEHRIDPNGPFQELRFRGDPRLSDSRKTAE